jgi:hypothetical protein
MARTSWLLATFGEVESMGTSTREMERLPLRNNAVFRTLLRPGKPGQTSKTTPFHQNWTRTRFNLQKTLTSPHMVMPSFVFVACGERSLTVLATAVKGVQN